MTKNMYGINNKSNGVVRMYVMTSVTHKREVGIDLLTVVQIVINFALELYSKCLLVSQLIRESQCLTNFNALRRGQLFLE